MIITRTPYRVSFFGGGTDYPAWFAEHGGAVLATTIDRYCYITCRRLPPFFEHRTRVVYSQIELVDDNRRIQHPAVRGVLEYLGVDDGLEIHHDGDLPAQTGLGSSSAFTVGLLHAVHALRGSDPPKLTLAREAVHVEQALLEESVGCQDQVMAAFGGLRRVDFAPDGAIHVAPVPAGDDRIGELQAHLLLFFTGFSRVASDIAREQIRRLASLGAELTAIRQMVDEAQAILTGGGDLMGFGRLLHESWLIKRRLTARIASADIDAVYDAARRAGAVGGKLLGAGGGGFMLFFAPPEAHHAIRAALSGRLEVPVAFERDGSRVIVRTPDPATDAEAAALRAAAVGS